LEDSHGNVWLNCGGLNSVLYTTEANVDLNVYLLPQTLYSRSPFVLVSARTSKEISGSLVMDFADGISAKNVSTH
jgi:hypothetical protein